MSWLRTQHNVAGQGSNPDRSLRTLRINHEANARPTAVKWDIREHNIHNFELTCNVPLLYRHTDDGVFDDFPKISDYFHKISEILQNFSEGHTNVPEHFPKNSQGYWRFPRTFGEDPKVSSYTNEFKYN